MTTPAVIEQQLGYILHFDLQSRPLLPPILAIVALVTAAIRATAADRAPVVALVVGTSLGFAISHLFLSLSAACIRQMQLSPAAKRNHTTTTRTATTPLRTTSSTASTSAAADSDDTDTLTHSDDDESITTAAPPPSFKTRGYSNIGQNIETASTSPSVPSPEPFQIHGTAASYYKVDAHLINSIGHPQQRRFRLSIATISCFARSALWLENRLKGTWWAVTPLLVVYASVLSALLALFLVASNNAESHRGLKKTLSPLLNDGPMAILALVASLITSLGAWYRRVSMQCSISLALGIAMGASTCWEFWAGANLALVASRLDIPNHIDSNSASVVSGALTRHTAALVKQGLLLVGGLLVVPALSALWLHFNAFSVN
eukprot:Protomagalhaensia_wolfi_Nauph_80__3321@NODE_337_length_2757_cov_7_148639_g254_i0_p2_GENE_NODE_337_length_2757_cov_7_148639_g254_i0NODE_337_length_2757_cov_7_148639_g254_i0_p2_ORF_typecomplete_len375_score39_91Shisa/PF13908_6/0_13DUF4514/PF14986_6/0_34DUF4514/PF14986_6/1e04_NODE_337_length_2757_cov_7_148639_g254_i0961220